MSKLQEILDKLQPFVIGIRYLEGTPLLDVVLKDGWIIPDEKDIKKIKGGEDSLNYFMIFSENKIIGLDSLLDYVDRAIKLNQEREQKHDLLRVKVNELKELFSINSLVKLNKLIFSFNDDIPTKIDEFGLDIDETQYSKSIPEQISRPQIEDVPFDIENKNIESIPRYLDSDGNPIELTEEEQEILAEEQRGLRNIQILKTKKEVPNSRNVTKTVSGSKQKLIISDDERDYEK